MKRVFWASGLLMALSPLACNFEERGPAEMVSLNKTQPMGKEKSLDANIHFGIGSLEVSGERTPALYSMDLEYDKAHYEPSVEYEIEGAGDEGRLSIKLESSNKVGLRSERKTNRMRLGFTDSLPLNLSVNTGVGDARLSLSRLKVARLEMESGVGGSKLSSYDPNPIECQTIRIRNGVGSMDAVGLGNLNFRELDFEGGVGGASLDFTGDWKQDAQIKIQVGVGGVNLRVPRDLGVKVDAEKHFLSGLHLERFVKRDSHYYSENYDKAKFRVSIRVATGIGGFKITWV